MAEISGNIAAPSSSTVFTAKGTKTVGNTTTRLTLIPTPVGSGSLTIPAPSVQVGTIIDIVAGCDYSTALSPGTLTIDIWLGGSVIGSAATTNLVANVSGKGVMRVGITIGDSGALTVSGHLLYDTGNNSPYGKFFANVGTPSVTLGQAALIDITAQWSSAQAANSITGNSCEINVSRA